jgi:hypothetical protein
MKKDIIEGKRKNKYDLKTERNKRQENIITEEKDLMNLKEIWR